MLNSDGVGSDLEVGTDQVNKPRTVIALSAPALAYAEFLSRNLDEHCRVRLNSPGPDQAEVIDIHVASAEVDSSPQHWVGTVHVCSALSAALSPALRSLAEATRDAVAQAGSPDRAGAWLHRDCPFKILYAESGLPARQLLDQVNAHYANESCAIRQRPNIIHVKGQYYLLRNERAGQQDPALAFRLANHRAQLSFADSEVLRLIISELRSRAYASVHYDGLARKAS